MINISVASLVSVGFVVLFFCAALALPQQKDRDDIMQKITFSEDLENQLDMDQREDQKKRLTDAIRKFGKALSADYAGGKYKDIGNELAARAAVIEDSRAEFAWIMGSAEISRLFTRLREEYPERKLTIEIRHVFVDKIFEDKHVDDGKMPVDMTATIFFKYAVIQKMGEESTNMSGIGTFSCVHRNDCTWCRPRPLF
jgi:hypothetical protein